MIAPAASTESITLLDALAASLRRAAEANGNDAVPPVVVLWPDADRLWEPLLPVLRERAAEGAGSPAPPPILALGLWQSAPLTGPAFWLRCAIAGTAPDANLPPESTLVVYLPGYSRADLRGVEECPKPIQPLAELQYRGTIWSHPNGRDWTPVAFLGSDATGLGLGIEVRTDVATRDALALALPLVAQQPLDALRRSAPLDAAWFHALLNPDPIRAILRWLDDPGGVAAATVSPAWTAFLAACRADWGFDLEQDGPLTAARLLGERSGRWKDAWVAFAENPQRFPGVAARLSQVDPPRRQKALFEPGRLPAATDPASSWPKTNQAEEECAAALLAALPAGGPAAARDQVLALEREQATRRHWVWAALGQATVAAALKPLADLARRTAEPVPGTTLTAMAAAYAADGWLADAAALAALAAVDEAPPEMAKGVRTAVDVLLRPWLTDQATRFQSLAVEAGPGPFAAPPPAAASPGTCLLFCDGLRMDLGHQLAELLTVAGREASVSHRLAAIPTVTPTAKPAVAPVAALLAGGADFDAAVAAGGKRLVKSVLDDLLRSAGWQVLAPTELGDPSGMAWTESGEIDRYGHNVGLKLASHARDELRRVAQRVGELLAQGWREVVVVTDHGWLLLPNGLPEATLELYLTVDRKGRCARLADGARPDLPIMPWRWDPAVRIALAPGIRSFVGTPVYDHGGLSPQEAVIPVVTVRAGGASAGSTVAIDRLRWTGLKLAVGLSGSATTQTADLRTRAGNPATSIAASVKPVDPDGTATLFVAPDKDDLEGQEAVFVVCGADGTVLAQRSVVVGGGEG